MKTRDKIIQASIELFNEHGERTITTNHIAAHLGISPGNLYYHFRNKQDIIQSIFKQYEAHLESSFQPYQEQKLDVEMLVTYFDAMFYVLWKFRFFYANLTDILGQDEKLKADYLHIQQMVQMRATRIIEQMNNDNVITLTEDEVPQLADTMKLVLASWISYKLAQSSKTTITKACLYEGVLRVIMITKAYAMADSIDTFSRLETHYNQLMTQADVVA
ncbi:TetR/AcrR family transcriptional regulator [Shewanella sp. 202IG2-18]|uniref:TetR/AcrR family transcriptional regulator n=1 Tax=Parashewanella hymeniacidonis TaxID=2807618 RepID=UPI00195F400D|nr:TetR/AcrR family transcriptional regulator [Parashewanella hymeniacidonis]MBM7071088.1 TetR/AcrR family transcriptional regulator [Parashewanella hymeniacidonis]